MRVSCAAEVRAAGALGQPRGGGARDQRLRRQHRLQDGQVHRRLGTRARAPRLRQVSHSLFATYVNV